MVDLIIEVKQDGLDDNGLVKWTFSIVFIDGEGDVDIPFLCILPVSIFVNKSPLKKQWLSYMNTNRNMVIAKSLRILNRIHHYDIGVTI